MHHLFVGRGERRNHGIDAASIFDRCSLWPFSFSNICLHQNKLNCCNQHPDSFLDLAQPLGWSMMLPSFDVKNLGVKGGGVLLLLLLL
eukprot:c34690_g1_i1 orf=3-263(-)